MTRSAAASSRGALVALVALFAFVATAWPVAAQAHAGEEEPQGPASLRVPSAAAPVPDGKRSEGEWDGAAEFEIGTTTQPLANLWLLRSGRDLFLYCRSRYGPWAIGVRLQFVDPVTRRQVTVVCAPLHPALPPIAVFRSQPDERPEPVSMATADLRFDLRPADGKGFRAELRLPLDLLEIGRGESPFEFRAEMWDLTVNRMLGAYPLTTKGPVVVGGTMLLRPEGDWGSDVPVSAEPAPRQPALELLESLNAERERALGVELPAEVESSRPEPVLESYLGVVDGKRRDAPLAALQERVTALIERYPDYFFLRDTLVRVLSGRNDLAGALGQVDRIEKDFPLIGGSPAHVALRAQLLHDLGRFDEALKYLDLHGDLIAGERSLAGLREGVAQRQREWRLELEMRAEDEARGDLPRVLLETNRGRIVIELFEDDAPNVVANFISLVESGFYAGTRFHWVERGGRLIGGDPNTKDEDPANDGFGDPGYLIESEPSRRLHLPFTVAMADKRRQARTEGSAFFLHISPFPRLDGRASVFGRVIEGRETVLRLEYYDTITGAKVLRKRDHTYPVSKRALP